MNFYQRSDVTPEDHRLLAHYDREVLQLLGDPRYPYPVRMRDWELCRVLQAMAGTPDNARILDTGSFNTYLGVYLSRIHSRVTVSDLLRARAIKSALRRIGLAPAKPTEAPYGLWRRAMRRRSLEVRSIDLTSIAMPDASFDRIISISVIEHIPEIEKALTEMYRVLAPGGKMLVTTDCSPEPRPYADGVRYFSEAELNRLFSGYPVTSPRNRPNFAKENWCYGGKLTVVTSFVEITKPNR